MAPLLRVTTPTESSQASTRSIRQMECTMLFEVHYT
jgi:hypothetical protein